MVRSQDSESPKVLPKGEGVTRPDSDPVFRRSVMCLWLVGMYVVELT